MPLSIAEAAAGIAAGRLSCAALVELCLERIERLEPALHAWVLVDAAGARAQAERLDAELIARGPRGPLHGIPIGVKDIIDVAGLPTLAGSALQAGHIAQRDATAVARLRDAGAIILGKTVTTEFACFDPSPTRNPWNRRHTPGGSSSGSAVAAATGMCLGALGTQTGGSITRPASYCGVAGCKPTFGRVSRAGVVPVSAHLDHVGVIARTVNDMAILLTAIAGPDPLDAYCRSEPVESCWPNAPGGRVPRIGLIYAFFREADAEVRSVCEAAVGRLSNAGAIVGHGALDFDFDELRRRHRTIMAVEAAEYHLQRHAEQPNSFGPAIRSLIAEGLATPIAAYQSALANQMEDQRRATNLFAEVDVLLTPATNTAAPASLSTTGDPRFNSPWSYLGLPTLSLPCGLTAGGMPVAIQLVEPAMGESLLFSIASWCERHLAFTAMPDLRASDRS